MNAAALIERPSDAAVRSPVRESARPDHGTLAFRVGEASGKYSANPTVFAKYVKRIIRRDNLDLITTTESKGMADALRRVLGPAWWVRIEGEFIVAGRRAVCDPGPGRLATISDEFNGSTDWRDTRVHYRWIRVHGVGPVLVAVLHWSSAVQHGTQWSGFDPGVESHRAATAAIGQQIRRRQRVAEVSGGRPVPIIVTGDTNLDQHVARWRDYMADTLGADGMWDARRPRGGTHAGGRLIDGIWSTAPIAQARLSRVEPKHPLDHRAVVAQLRLPRNGPRPSYDVVHSPTPWAA